MTQLIRQGVLGAILFFSLASTFACWHALVGFNPFEGGWWLWALRYINATGTLPQNMTLFAGIILAIGLFTSFAAMLFLSRATTSTTAGGRKVKDTHGSARFAKWGEIKAAGLLENKGVVIGGFSHRGRVHQLTHNGPEHLMAFAPTRSGKGVCLVIPTLLNWEESVLVLDIKGENYALTAGYRESLGHRVIRFDPAALKGSARYNPLAEVRYQTDHEIADCQNIAAMIVDPDGKGLKDYWMQSGWAWLSASILHVLYRTRHKENRTATLGDVHKFMCLGEGETQVAVDANESFNQLCDEMADFDHGRESVNGEIRRAAAEMKKKYISERSGVHSSAKTQLSLYADPIVARNISDCDFRIKDLMNADKPTALYIVIPPSDIDRLKPLVRIVMNQFLTRLTRSLYFDQEAKSYKHRLLLMLDEFTSIGKLEIFERSLAFMAGYGLKAFLIVQDLTQLQKAYSKEESILSNCHVRIAYAPNKIETARLLSDMAGKTTLVQKTRSASLGKGLGGGEERESVVSRPLLTADECMSLPGIRTKGSEVIPGDMLIFMAGDYPIYGRQRLFFQDETFRKRTQIPCEDKETT